MKLVSLIYVSTASLGLTKAEVADIVTESARNNERNEITGLLLYNGLNFCQVIEGEADAIEALYRRLGADPRHTGLVRILHRPIETREFDGWSMAFGDVEPLAHIDGDGRFWKTSTQIAALLDRVTSIETRGILQSFNTLQPA